MMDPEDEDYVCDLTDYSLHVAIKELNEDPKQRLGAVQALRKWIREQPHYTCKTDTKFLLAYLRKAKFSQLAARDLIDKFMNGRTLYPEYMTNIDVQDPSIMAYVEKGVFLVLPKPDKEGRSILIFRPGMIDLKDPRFDIIKETRCTIALNEMMRDVDESRSVHGAIIVVDCTGMGLKYLNSATGEQKKIKSRIFQDCSTVRTKAFIAYNVGTLAEILMTLVKTLLKKKLQERVYVHNTMESLYKRIPMELWPTEYLPDDYRGPSAGSIDSIIAAMKKQMMNPQVRNTVLSNTSDRYKIDESKQPRDSAPQESFRRLNID